MGDALWYYKTLGLHMDGTNGSTTFTDVKGETVTVGGGAQISTAQYPNLTGKSSAAYFDGSGDYLTVGNSSGFNFGSGDFTIRGMFRCSSFGSGRILIHRGEYTNYTAWAIQILSSGKLYTCGSTSGSSWAWEITAANSVSVDTWHLFELSREGTSVYFFQDGDLLGSATGVSGSLMSSSANVCIGVNAGLNDIYIHSGYMSEVEIYKGVALHAASYTPSSSPFSDEYVSVSGVVRDVTGTPCARTVDIYRSDTGALVGRTTSNGTTGAYKVTAANSGSATPMAHFVVCHDDDYSENALVLDNITPA